MQKWTEEEIKFLEEHYSKDNINLCIEFLNRSKSSITTKASRLKLTKGIKIDRFTEDEILFLINNYNSLGVHECSEILNRSYFSVALKASRLNLTTKNSSNHPSEQFIVYNIYFPLLNIYKIGYTTNLSRRFAEFKSPVKIIELFYFKTKSEAKIKEMELLIAYKTRLKDTGLLPAGNSETYI